MTKFQPLKKKTDIEKIVISIRLNIDKVEKLDNLANKIDISRNQLITQCIDYALNNLDFKNDDNK